jgi:hypothetical protein
MTETTFHTTECNRCHKIELGKAHELGYYLLTIKPFSSSYGEVNSIDICPHCYKIIQRVLMISDQRSDANKKKRHKQEGNIRKQVLNA